MTRDDLRWSAVQRRDAAQDGSFFYGVVTTGVFCRPSCPSRLPLRTNVRFFQTPESAEGAGLRACLRCKPGAADAATAADAAIEKACGILQATLEESPDCEELASRVGMSTSHFHRTFKRVTGVSPAQYRKRLRMDALKRRLKEGDAVTEGVYASGFGSSSRLYESSDARLGMTPGQYRRGGQGVTISFVSIASPLGFMMLGATERGLCFLQFGDGEEPLKRMLEAEYPSAQIQRVTQPYSRELQGWMQNIGEFLEGRSALGTVPVDTHATAFQLRVWQYLQAIPQGEVRSYSEIARDLGSPKAGRAVAGACAANRVALVIPCHRVLRNNGELGGFRWGLERKRKLLDLEAAGKVSGEAGRELGGRANRPDAKLSVRARS